MVRKRRAKGQAREQKVIEAAVLAIAELGMDKVRMADVAERAGMSQGHVTYYFETKAELLMEAIRWSEERFHQLVMDQIQTVSDPWERLGQLFELTLADGPGDPSWLLWFEVWSYSGNDPTFAEIHEELEGWWRTTMAGVIRYGHAEGAFAGEDADEAARLFLALTDGLSIQLTLGAKNFDREAALAMCQRTARLLLEPTRAPAHSS